MRHSLQYLLYSLLCATTTVFAQSSYIPLGSYSIHVLDRMEIKQGRLATPAEFNTTTKAYKRESIAHYVDSFNLSSAKLSKQDYFNLAYLQTDNFEYSNSENTRTKRSLWGTGIYKHKAAFVDVTIPDFVLVVNPVTHQKFEYDNNLKQPLWLNNKGIEMRGKIGNSFSFYTQASDIQQMANTWDQAFYQADTVLPGQAFLKTFDHGKTFDYWAASGYAAWQAGKYFDIQFGHGRNFIGNGYRSLMMSDFSRDHLFLRVNTRVWKINYTNIWGQMYDYVVPGRRNLPKRHYYATTYANMNITKRLNIGLFQTISFQRDSGYDNPGYDPQYLNPIIFYKPIENGLNSPDKTIIGMDFKYNFAKHFSVYGQLVISELIIGNVFSTIDSVRGWAGNKDALQIGIKYIDVFGISNLDLQLEHNRARPYMYSSFSPKNAYVNYNQNMAHPIGANFKENIVIIRFQPTNKLFINAKAIMTTYGNDTNGSNWGKDIRKNYYTFEKEYGNTIGQGVTTHLYIADIIASYMFWHNMFIDFELTYRQTSSSVSIFNSKTINPSIAFRWNINARAVDY
jgi:hypothetical protein